MQINHLLQDTYTKLTASKFYNMLVTYFDYNNINNILISNILIHKINDKDKLNIFLELETYLDTLINNQHSLLTNTISHKNTNTSNNTNNSNNTNTISHNNNNTSNIPINNDIISYYKSIKKLLHTINTQSHKPQNTQSYKPQNNTNITTNTLLNKIKYPTQKQMIKLKELLDNDPRCGELKGMFFTHLKSMNKIDANSELLLNPYTSLLNLHYIYLDTDYYITYQAELNYDSIYYVIDLKDIILYAPRTSKLVKALLTDTDKIYVITYLRDISSRVLLFKVLLKTTNKPENIQLYLTNYKKEFMNDINMENDTESNIFTSNEINTGVTNGRQIIITREEECMKTLIHEAIHFYNMDFRDIPEYINEWVFGNFNIESYSAGDKNSSILIFESYTEFMASIIHIISRVYNSQSKQVTLLTATGKLKMFLRILKEQITYTFNKCCQILAVSKCQNFDEFKISGTTRNTNTSSNGTCKLVENTNVFCYYYLKLCMYLHLGSVFNICCKETGSFINEDKSYRRLLSIFKSCASNNLFQTTMSKGINKYYKLYKTKHNKDTLNISSIKTKKYNIKSLKMVILD
jgi:hypothetical protein